MTHAFEIANQGGEPGPEEAGTLSRFIEGGVVDLLAFPAPTGMSADADDGDHLGRRREFDLLNDFGRLLAACERAMTIGAFGAKEFGVLDVGVVEGVAEMGRMSGLAVSDTALHRTVSRAARSANPPQSACRARAEISRSTIPRFCVRRYTGAGIGQ